MPRRTHSDSLAPYRNWAKRLAPPQWNLAESHVHPCTLDDLPGALEAVSLYERSDGGYPPLHRALARRFGMGTENITTSRGGTGATFLALAALIRPGDKVVTEWPTDDAIIGAVRLLGGKLIDMTREWHERFALDPNQLAINLTHDVKAIVLTNPHDPTGAYTNRTELLEIGALADIVGAKVIVEEVYLDTLSGVDTKPAATLGDTFISTNSVTRSYGLPGLRLGWMLADAETTERAREVQDVVEGAGATIVDRVGVVAVGQMDRLLARARGILEPNMELLASFVEERPELEWLRPVGGAVAFPRLTSGADSEPFVHMAHEEFGVGLVPGRLFGCDRHFRISAGVPRETLRGGLEALGRALDRGLY